MIKKKYPFVRQKVYGLENNKPHVNLLFSLPHFCMCVCVCVENENKNKRTEFKISHFKRDKTEEQRDKLMKNSNSGRKKTVIIAAVRSDVWTTKQWMNERAIITNSDSRQKLYVYTHFISLCVCFWDLFIGLCFIFCSAHVR